MTLDSPADSWIDAVRATTEIVSKVPLLGSPPLQRLSPVVLAVGADPDLITALKNLGESLRYAKSRRSTPTIDLSAEAGLQDVLYIAVKPWIIDFTYETPTARDGGGFALGDFWSPSRMTLVEAKFVRSRSDVRRIADEISEDIWKYANGTDCTTIVFVVYDPHESIPDRHLFITSLSTDADKMRLRERNIHVETIVLP